MLLEDGKKTFEGELSGPKIILEEIAAAPRTIKCGKGAGPMELHLK